MVEARFKMSDEGNWLQRYLGLWGILFLIVAIASIVFAAINPIDVARWSRRADRLVIPIVLVALYVVAYSTYFLFSQKGEEEQQWNIFSFLRSEKEKRAVEVIDAVVAVKNHLINDTDVGHPRVFSRGPVKFKVAGRWRTFLIAELEHDDEFVKRGGHALEVLLIPLDEGVRAIRRGGFRSIEYKKEYKLKDLQGFVSSGGEAQYIPFGELQEEYLAALNFSAMKRKDVPEPTDETYNIEEDTAE